MTKPAGQDQASSQTISRDDFTFDGDLNLWKLTKAAGAFGYNDGDAHENYLFETIKAAKDRSVLSKELALGMKDWPSTYHLHHQRCNVFRAIAEHISGPVLEIGAGCGVLTRFLGEEGHETFALEGSPRRASIIGERCRDLENVHVINANFQDFKTDTKFQTITLIGVLEYARVYFSDGSDTDPVDQMLGAVRKLLAPDGVLIVAIENKLGLKYFAGFNEDHFGRAMYGVQDLYTDTSIVTFGHAELQDRIQRAGFNHLKAAYPFPDYKFPQAVLFDSAMQLPLAPQFAALVSGAMATDRQKPVAQTFSLHGAARSVMENGLGADMANSFIMIASPAQEALDLPDDTLAIHFGNCDRKDAYLKTARMSRKPQGILVERSAMTDSQPEADAPFDLVLEDEFFTDGVLWTNQLQNIFLNPKWKVDDLVEWASVWLNALKSDIQDDTFIFSDPMQKLDGAYCDAIPRNLIVDRDGKATFIDQEWRLKKPMELGFLFVRGMRDAFFSVDVVLRSKQPSGFDELTRLVGEQCGLLLSDEDLRRYMDQEFEFQRAVNRKPVSKKRRSRYLPVQRTDASRNRQVMRYRRRLKSKGRAMKSLSRFAGRFGRIFGRR